MAYASFGTVTTVSSAQFSSTKSAVMIFVVLAIGSLACAFCENSTRFVFASISTAPDAPMEGVAAKAGSAAPIMTKKASKRNSQRIDFIKSKMHRPQVIPAGRCPYHKCCLRRLRRRKRCFVIPADRKPA